MGHRIEYKSKNYKHVNKLICENSVNAKKLWQGSVCSCNRQFETEKEIQIGNKYVVLNIRSNKLIV